MVDYGSATAREETPHASNSFRTTISNAVRRRAQSVINDRSIDAPSRAAIRYGLETNDPWLAELIVRVDAGETIVNPMGFTQSTVASEDVSSEEKIEALAEMICGDDDESGIRWAAFLVLMATLENAMHPKALANTAKHLAFARCGELNVYGMVDAQIASLEGELIPFSSGL